MRLSRWLTAILLLAVLATSLPLQAAPARLATPPPTTLIPLGPTQPDPRTAYRDVLVHLFYAGGRVHWASAEMFSPTVHPGDLIIPGGLDTGADHQYLTTTLPISRAYALRPGGIAILRSTFTVTQGQNQFVAMWELAEIRQFLDGYLWYSLPYTVLDEAAILSGGLAGLDILIIPTIRADAVLSVTQALADAGVLAVIHDFVQAGGTLYAQSNGAYVAEVAGLLPSGTVDLETVIELDVGSEPNQGQLVIQSPDSPLAWSWLTDTLYILTDPLLHPSPEMEVVATLANAGDAPAIVRAETGEGQVVLVAGHPTDDVFRIQAPIFLDAILLALSSRAELTGDAIQTFNRAYDPHEFPAYEAVPISTTLTAANLWDTPIANIVVTETVSDGYFVTETTIFPTPTAFYTVTVPTTATVIVWDLGELAPGAEVQLCFWSRSDPQTLAAGIGIFSTGEMSYVDEELGPLTIAHRPFVLTAQMAARLVGDRDLEADRHYRIPAEGIYLDMVLFMENKEWTTATNVLATDWIYLLYPIVEVENQHIIYSANDGETIWIRNEPYLWENGTYPLPVGAPSPTYTYTLDDWQGDYCTFTSTVGIFIDPPPGYGPQSRDYGSFITIPPTYSQYITVTSDHELLLPCLPLTFDLGDWPGYWYEEPAIRYGIHSRELFSRTVVFHGTPRPNTVVIPHDAGSVYVAAGGDPVPYREYLEHEVPYAAAAPGPVGVTYQDVWSRTHSLPFRATFYDTWDWDSCAGCGGLVERHAAFNLTFGLTADLDGDGIPETEVREIPTRLAETWVTFMGKSYNLAEWTIPEEMNLIDFPIFHGLGIQIVPRNEDWFDSYSSPAGHTTLVAVTETEAYDHLIFQQDIPPGVAEIFYVDGTIYTYEMNREGMFKLHDGARLVYRQMLAGENRYEIYDSHVHSVIGLSSDGRVIGRVGPTAISVYGDSIYYLYEVDDLYDPRTFDEDPYMNSWGYGDFVATSYVGGREQKTVFHSIVASNDRSRSRISLDNNTGVTLTDVTVTIESPYWITVTQLYTDPLTAPEPIWPELAFLNVEIIPDAWRGVYYYDLDVADIPADLIGTVITLPVTLVANGLPQAYKAPPLVLALRDAVGNRPPVTFGLADELVLTDTLSLQVSVQAAALLNATQAMSLANATDFDAQHPLSDTAAILFATFAPTLPFTVDDSVVTFDLPEEWRVLPASDTLYLAAHTVITRAHHGPNQVGEGGTICYTDPFGVRWCDEGESLIVEAGGAVVVVDYFCEGGGAGVQDDGFGHCTIPPTQTSEILLRVTVYNQGDALARNVTATIELPGGVTPVQGLEPQSFGDIAPGGWKSIWVTLRVTPTSGDIEPDPSGWLFTVVNHTWGQFFDTASQQTISGQFGDDYAVNVEWKNWLVYLPMILSGHDDRPDLTVVTVSLNSQDPNDLQVVITNQGNSTAHDIWVDGYLDPDTPPEVNQAWEDLGCSNGIVWIVDALAPGHVLTLTVGDAYFSSTYSLWPETEYSAGSHTFWTFVDSWGPPQPYGAVDELDESNNRYGPLSFDGTGPHTPYEQPAIPPRPVHP